MTESLLSSFGLYGGALVLAFVSGLFPVLSVEVYLVGISTLRTPPLSSLAVMILLASLGHQLAKTITYYAGVGALELPNGRVRDRIERARSRVERWNRHPKLVMFLATTVGLPPMYLIGFIAKPLMHLEFIPFTLWTLFGRTARYATIAAIPLLF